MLLRPGPHRQHRGVDEIDDRDRLGQLALLVGVDARELQELLDHVLHALHFFQAGAQDLLVLRDRPWPAQRQLELGTQA